jgi:hypothetical protein
LRATVCGESRSLSALDLDSECEQHRASCADRADTLSVDSWVNSTEHKLTQQRLNLVDECELGKRNST